MELQSIMMCGLGVLLAIVGFILKQLWTDIRENKENSGKLKGRIELVDQKLNQGLENTQHVSNLKFKQLNEKLDTMCTDLKEDIHDIIMEIKAMHHEPTCRDDKGRFAKRDD